MKITNDHPAFQAPLLKQEGSKITKSPLPPLNKGGIKQTNAVPLRRGI